MAVGIHYAQIVYLGDIFVEVLIHELCTRMRVTRVETPLDAKEGEWLLVRVVSNVLIGPVCHVICRVESNVVNLTEHKKTDNVIHVDFLRKRRV